MPTKRKETKVTSSTTIENTASTERKSKSNSKSAEESQSDLEYDSDEIVDDASESETEDKLDIDDETVDVDFEFFDPKEIDFHGIKSLLAQTFSTDAEFIPLSEFSDILIAQPQIGSCVKVNEGGDDDPFAIMSVINLNTHAKTEAVIQLKAYLLERIAKQVDAHTKLSALFSNTEKHLGWMCNERLINMPPQIVTPMLKMLIEELGWAVEDKEAFDFEYLMIVSKMYHEVNANEIDEDDEEKEDGSIKVKKQKLSKKETTIAYNFQPEDEIFFKYAEFSADFTCKNKSQVSDSKRAFQDTGIEPFRRIMVVPRSKLSIIFNELESFLQ